MSVVWATALPFVAGARSALTKAVTIRCWRSDSLVYAPTTGSVVGRVVLAAVTAVASIRSKTPLISVDDLGRVARARSARRLCKALAAKGLPNDRRRSGSKRRAESGEADRLVVKSVVQRPFMCRRSEDRGNGRTKVPTA